MTLTGPMKEAKSGKPDALVVFIHGYGADGNDLIGLADTLSGHLKNVIFASPNAPDRCTNNPMGYQWFPIPYLDGSSEAAAMEGLKRAEELLNEYLDHLADETGIPADRTILFGFSQGTMLSLDVGPKRKDMLAGIVGFSGRLLNSAELDVAVTKPPILLIHGDQDEVVPPQSLPEAADTLTKSGFKVYTHISKGTGHGIAPDGLKLALGFIREVLEIK